MCIRDSATTATKTPPTVDAATFKELAYTVVSWVSAHGCFFITHNICTHGRLSWIENASVLSYGSVFIHPLQNRYLGAYPGILRCIRTCIRDFCQLAQILWMEGEWGMWQDQSLIHTTKKAKCCTYCLVHLWVRCKNCLGPRSQVDRKCSPHCHTNK